MDEYIYSKTGKGLRAINTGTSEIPSVAASVLAQVDGKSSAIEVHMRCPELSSEQVKQAFDWLLHAGYAKALASELQTIHAPASNAGVVMLDPVEGLQEWAKAQRMTKDLANVGYCSSGSAGQSKPINASILIVEDDPQLAQLEIALLRREGYKLSHVSSGELALEKLETGALPDVVILDIVLPGIDGFETLRTLRAKARTANLRVVMVTSRVSDEDVMEGLISGADGYIFKPFRPEKLTNNLLEVLGW
ncbi:response regulator transcription factor [Sulfurirhabdus autotrophica]|uniref:Response regulator receiver domain-containing protein n=1 Tax=Sulfurirhabdus autotrophica TaxID=1706046 RepID=A0A4R3Y412_9PROT|nr:response regulator [Sulfurirhabdus autotrophica]TCV86407.1 response regulator receiver domain-containing protein [Sulfurirhabdus autotrophica]